MADKDKKIKNVGPKSAAWLRQVGIRSIADLQRIGAVESFLKVKRAGFRPSLNLLYALAGAIANCHWTELPDEQRSGLLLAVDAAESLNPIKTRWQKASDASASGAAPVHSDESDSPTLPETDFLEDPNADASAESANSDGNGSSRFD